ncbi:MAG: DUF542 domain-containing protein [Gemmatimonadetes bacterium]|nr:DUF542 domain-containing protein [Gemmatimonadota bacterium]
MSTGTPIRPEMTVGAIAEQYPASAPVLARHGIDLCCGGKHTLEFAARAHGVDLAALLVELEGAGAGR